MFPHAESWHPSKIQIQKADQWLGQNLQEFLPAFDLERWAAMKVTL